MKIHILLVRADKGPEQLLAEYLLSNYSSLGRPVKDPKEAINVSIQFYLTELISMVRSSSWPWRAKKRSAY